MGGEMGKSKVYSGSITLLTPRLWNGHEYHNNMNNMHISTYNIGSHDIERRSSPEYESADYPADPEKGEGGATLTAEHSGPILGGLGRFWYIHLSG